MGGLPETTLKKHVFHKLSKCCHPYNEDKYDTDLFTLKTFQCLCTVYTYLFLQLRSFFFSFFQNMQPDKEILFDVITFLWQKCKMGLQQIQTSGSGYFKYIHKYKACKVLLYYNVFLLI